MRFCALGNGLAWRVRVYYARDGSLWQHHRHGAIMYLRLITTARPPVYCNIIKLSVSSILRSIIIRVSFSGDPLISPFFFLLFLERENCCEGVFLRPLPQNVLTHLPIFWTRDHALQKKKKENRESPFILREENALRFSLFPFHSKWIFQAPRGYRTLFYYTGEQWGRYTSPLLMDYALIGKLRAKRMSLSPSYFYSVKKEFRRFSIWRNLSDKHYASGEFFKLEPCFCDCLRLCSIFHEQRERIARAIIFVLLAACT
jgi:hypothetical protein